MPAKKVEYERIFNELLGTSIKWSNLRLEDLIQLAILFNNPELLMKKLGVADDIRREEIKRRLGGLLYKWMEEWEGPLARLVRRLLG